MERQRMNGSVNLTEEDTYLPTLAENEVYNSSSDVPIQARPRKTKTQRAHWKRHSWFGQSKVNKNGSNTVLDPAIANNTSRQLGGSMQNLLQGRQQNDEFSLMKSNLIANGQAATPAHLKRPLKSNGIEILRENVREINNGPSSTVSNGSSHFISHNVASAQTDGEVYINGKNKGWDSTESISTPESSQKSNSRENNKLKLNGQQTSEKSHSVSMIPVAKESPRCVRVKQPTDGTKNIRTNQIVSPASPTSSTSINTGNSITLDERIQRQRSKEITDCAQLAENSNELAFLLRERNKEPISSDLSDTDNVMRANRSPEIYQAPNRMNNNKLDPLFGFPESSFRNCVSPTSGQSLYNNSKSRSGDVLFPYGQIRYRRRIQNNGPRENLTDHCLSPTSKRIIYPDFYGSTPNLLSTKNVLPNSPYRPQPPTIKLNTPIINSRNRTIFFDESESDNERARMMFDHVSRRPNFNGDLDYVQLSPIASDGHTLPQNAVHSRMNGGFQSPDARFTVLRQNHAVNGGPEYAQRPGSWSTRDYGTTTNERPHSGNLYANSPNSFHREMIYGRKITSNPNKVRQPNPPNTGSRTGPLEHISPKMYGRRMIANNIRGTYSNEHFQTSSHPNSDLYRNNDDVRLIIEEPDFSLFQRDSYAQAENKPINFGQETTLCGLPNWHDEEDFYTEHPVTPNRTENGGAIVRKYSDSQYLQSNNIKRAISEMKIDELSRERLANKQNIDPESYIRSRPNIRSGFGGNYKRPNAGISMSKRRVSLERSYSRTLETNSSSGASSILTNHESDEVALQTHSQKVFNQKPLSINCLSSLRNSTFCLSQSHLVVPTIPWIEKSERERQSDAKLLRLIRQLPDEQQNTTEMILLRLCIQENSNHGTGGLESRLREALQLVPPNNPNVHSNESTGMPSTTLSDDTCVPKPLCNGVSTQPTKSMLDPRMTQSCYESRGTEDSQNESHMSNNFNHTMGSSLDSTEANSDVDETGDLSENTCPQDHRNAIFSVLRKIARCLAARIASKRQRLEEAQQKLSRSTTEEKLLKIKLQDIFILSDHANSPCCTRADNSSTISSQCESPFAHVLVRFERWHNSMRSVVQLLCQLAWRLAWLDAKTEFIKETRHRNPDFKSYHRTEELKHKKSEIEVRIKEAQELKAGLEDCRLRLLDGIPPGVPGESPSMYQHHHPTETSTDVDSTERSSHIPERSPVAPNRRTPILLRDWVADHLFNTLEALVTFYLHDTSIRVEQEVYEMIRNELQL